MNVCTSGRMLVSGPHCIRCPCFHRAHHSTHAEEGYSPLLTPRVPRSSQDEDRVNCEPKGESAVNLALSRRRLRAFCPMTCTASPERIKRSAVCKLCFQFPPRPLSRLQSGRSSCCGALVQPPECMQLNTTGTLQRCSDPKYHAPHFAFSACAQDAATYLHQLQPPALQSAPTSCSVRRISGADNTQGPTTVTAGLLFAVHPRGQS